MVARRCFKKQRHVNDKPVYRRILPRRLHLRKTFLVQQGMNKSFQNFSAFRIAEDQLSQEMSVRPSRAVHAAGAERP